MGRNNADFGGGAVYQGEGIAEPGGWRNTSLGERTPEQSKGELGAKWDRHTALVPVSKLKAFMEYDRAGKEGNGDYSQGIINSIAEDLKKGGSSAMREPLQLDYDHEAKWGHLGEGNHRLAAAIQAGVTHVPVTIFRSHSVASNKAKGIGAPLHLDNRVVERGGYYPSPVHPGNFKEFEGAK